MKKVLDKYKRLPIQVKAVFWLTFCTLLQKGISVITVPIFTRIMSTRDYGIFTVFISWQNIIQLFTSLSLHTGVFNTAMIKNDERHDIVVSSYLGLTTVINVLAFSVYCLFHIQINRLMGISSQIGFFLFLNLLLSPAINLWTAQQRFEYKYQQLVIYTVISSLANPIVSYFAVINASDKAFTRIASSTFVAVIFYGIIYVLIFSEGRVFFDKELWKNALIVNVPLIPHFLLSTILNQADRLMISQMVGNSKAGIYSVGYSAAMLLQIVISSINASLVPWMYRKIKDNKVEDIRGILNIASFLMFWAVILFMLFAPECMKILASREYYEAIWIFPPLTASVFFIFIYNLFCNVELYYEQSVYITVSSCMAAGLNVALNYLLIPVLGYVAAGYTTLISYIAYAGFHFVFEKKIIRNKGIKNPVNGKFILLLSALMLLISAAVNMLYKYTAVRYILIAIIVGIVFIFREKIMSIMKEIRNR